MIRIALADDHRLFREGLATVLSSQAHFNVVIEAAGGEELLEKMEKLVPDVLLLDLKMPGMDGIEVAKRVKTDYPKVRIIILTMHHQEDFVLHMLNLGVNAYLFKNASSQEVFKAIEQTYERDYYFDEHISRIMLKGLKKRQRHEPKLDGTTHLSPREVEVLQLICQELTTAQIADKLFLSHRTVETHRKNLLEKLGAKNTAGLVIKAVSMSLFEVKML